MAPSAMTMPLSGVKGSCLFSDMLVLFHNRTKKDPMPVATVGYDLLWLLIITED